MQKTKIYIDFSIYIYFDGENLVSILYLLGCSKTFVKSIEIVKYTNLEICFKYIIALVIVVKSNETVLVLKVEQARELNLPKIYNNRDFK